MMKPMTWQKLLQRILDGRGQGHGDDYLPWLWVHRKNASPVSNQVVSRLPGYLRASHFFREQSGSSRCFVDGLGATIFGSNSPCGQCHILTPSRREFRTGGVPTCRA